MLTTFYSYGDVSSRRQSELIQGLGKPQVSQSLTVEDMAEAVVRKMREANVNTSALAATGRTLDVAGELHAITPIRVRELPAFARAVEPFAAELAEGLDLAALLARHADALIEAAAIGARRERAWVDGLALDDLVRIVEAVLEVNLDFFARRLMPAVTAAAERINAQLAGSNSTPASGQPV